LNQNSLLIFCLSTIFSENRFPLYEIINLDTHSQWQ